MGECEGGAESGREQRRIESEEKEQMTEWISSSCIEVRERREEKTRSEKVQDGFGIGEGERRERGG